MTSAVIPDSHFKQQRDRTPTSPQHDVPEPCMNFAALTMVRAQGKPVPIAPMGPVQQKSTGVGPQVNRSNAGFPCAMVYGLLRALPGDRACLPPSPPRSLLRESLNASIGAPGPHDFAVRDDRRSSVAITRVHRIPPQRS